MPIGFTNITSSTARTRKLVHNTWFKRLRNKILRTKHSAKFEWREYNFYMMMMMPIKSEGHQALSEIELKEFIGTLSETCDLVE